MSVIDEVYGAVVLLGEGIAHDFIAAQAPALASRGRAERQRCIQALKEAGNPEARADLERLHAEIETTISAMAGPNEMGPLDYRDAFDVGFGVFWFTVRDELPAAVARRVAERPIGAPRRATLHETMRRRRPGRS